ncbi:MAG: response regulator [Planctomycetota bacterium]
MTRPTVYVVDDDEAVRHSLEFWLRSLELDVHGFPSGEAFLSQADIVTPSCLVVDLRMPDMTGLELQERLNSEGIRVPVIFLTGHGTIPQAVQAMSRGAIDFLEKPYEKEVLYDRIQKAIAKDERESFDAQRLDELRERRAGLTQRQLEVLERVVEGKANKVIAIELGLSEKTIELHRAKMMRRMGADSLAELVKMWVALQQGNGVA